MNICFDFLHELWTSPNDFIASIVIPGRYDISEFSKKAASTYKFTRGKDVVTTWVVSTTKERFVHHCKTLDCLPTPFNFKCDVICNEICENWRFLSKSSESKNVDFLIGKCSSDSYYDKSSSRILRAMQYNGISELPCQTDGCPYRNHIKNNIEKDILLASFQSIDANVPKRFQKRDILIVDGYHNLENDISNMYEFTITNEFLTKLGIPKYPHIETTADMKKYIEEFLLQRVNELYLQNLENLHQSSDNMMEYVNELMVFRGYYQKMNMFLQNYSDENWVISHSKTSTSAILINIAPILKNIFSTIADKVILLSECAFDNQKCIQSLGIGNVCEYICDIPSNSNMPCIAMDCDGIGSMSSKKRDENLPLMTSRVIEYIKTHDKSLVIYTGNNYINKHIVDHIIDGGMGDLILAYSNPAEKGEIINKILSSPDNFAFICPSIDDVARIASIKDCDVLVCKVPYMNYNDARVSVKNSKNPWWYGWHALSQVVKLSSRFMNNGSVVYVLDSDFINFYGMVNSSWLKQCINAVQR